MDTGVATQGLAETRERLLAMGGMVVFDAGNEAGVAKTDAISRGRSEEGCIAFPGHRHHGQAPRNPRSRARARARVLTSGSWMLPSVRRLNPWMSPLPAMAVSVTRRCSPGSNRALAPAGRSRRLPKGRAAIELEVAVGLEEVIVAGNMNRPVAAVENGESVFALPSLRVMSPSPTSSSPGRQAGSKGSFPGAYRLPDGHCLQTVVEMGIDVDKIDHLRHAGEHVIGRQECRGDTAYFGQRVPVACRLHDLVGNQRHRLGLIEPEATGPSLACELRCREEGQPVDFPQA